MKIYRGVRTPESCAVTVDGRPLDCPRGFPGNAAGEFEWGYDGAGPMRLSYAILADHFGDEAQALTYHRAFLTDFVARIADDTWALSEDRIGDVLATVDVPMTLAELMKKARDG
jgi:hypothetical protein